MAGLGDQERRSRALAYVLEVLLGDAAAAQLGGSLAYEEANRGAAPDARLCIVPSRFFGPAYGTAASLPELPLAAVQGVPLLYGRPVIDRQGDRLVVHADLVASAFFLLTRCEEMVRRHVRDGYGRFPATQSLPHRAGFLERPIVEEYGRLLRRWLSEAGVSVPEPGRRFSVLLTHDVDVVARYPSRRAAARVAVRALLGRRSFRKFPRAFGVALGLARDPHDTFDELLALDRAAGAGQPGWKASAVYFFMAGGGNKLGGDYDVRSPRVRRLVRKIRDSGAAIGLHASLQASAHPERIAQEKATLEDVCGCPVRRSRFHFLAFREIEHGWALAQAGIDWDSSLGYPDAVGFRLGVCHPIPLFDPVQMRPFGIEEHPLIVMDGALTHPKHMGLGEDEAFDRCQRLLRQTREHNGEFVALWHNDKLARERGNPHPSLYRRFLRAAVDARQQAPEWPLTAP